MSQLSRRGFLGVAGGAALASGLAACAGTGSGSSSSGGGGGSANTIDFWSNHPGKSKAAEQKIIAAFEKANPKLKVKLTDAGKDYEEVAQKFNAALAGGNLPDVVVTSDVTWFNFALNNRLADVGALFQKNGLSTSDYVDGLYADYRYEGKHFAIPYARSTIVFYYNKDVFKKAGLPDRAPTSWDEFTQWAPKLQSAIGNGKHALILDDGANYLDWTFQAINWSYGGAYSKEWTPTFDDPKTLKAATVLQGWAKSKYLKTSADSASDFGAGLGAVLLESTGNLGGFKDLPFELGVGFVPAPGGIKACPTGGAGVAIPSGISAERQNNAAKFVEFLTNAQNTATFTQATGYMPVRKSALKEPSEAAYLQQNPNFNVAVQQLPKTRPQDYARVFVPGGGASIGQALDKIVAGADVAATMKALNGTISSAYNSQVKPKLKS
ncbi:ABC transporter substrate-binding protein [Calidifontibacter sp. DB0510]|uniref:ABC transporter substrate-binding protein n=1 Tax=Metallococcus carri TaxID=1656884 RepID=A0A967AY90_9MICO|nr:ABC transporter substrate-binding protein [Metallococcus carri]NHN54938.1 ABC transporter substrate-binding protein [Metallococcus carri]NOP37284.1 ABC transporter substrate-binding protein [Calidifontibacter sp. DB2511S]